MIWLEHEKACEEFDRTLPGEWSPHDGESWLPYDRRAMIAFARRSYDRAYAQCRSEGIAPEEVQGVRRTVARMSYMEIVRVLRGE